MALDLEGLRYIYFCKRKLPVENAESSGPVRWYSDLNVAL